MIKITFTIQGSIILPKGSVFGKDEPKKIFGAHDSRLDPGHLLACDNNYGGQFGMGLWHSRNQTGTLMPDDTTNTFTPVYVEF